MNKFTSTLSIKLMHGKLTDAQLLKLMERIAKAAQGRSRRSVGVFCGDQRTWRWGKGEGAGE